MKDTVCIVGSHPRTREAVNWNKDADYWLFNEAARQDWAKKCDAVFQMHSPVIWKNPTNRNDPEHYQWLQSATMAVYMQDHYKDVPASVKYPLNEICAALLPNFHMGENPARYFSSSIDYAIALAIFQGYKRIEVYGVELETQTEYFYQRAGFAFWAGVAIGGGKSLHCYNSIFDSPLYGYEGDAVLDYSVIVGRIDELSPTVATLRQQYEAQTKAAGEAFEKFLVEGTREAAEAFHKLNEVQRELGQQLSKIDGQLQENTRYKNKADAMRKASGDFAFSRQEFEGASVDMQKRVSSEMAKANVSGGRAEVVFNEMLRTSKEKHRRKKAAEFVAHIQEHMTHLFYAALFMGAYEENMSYMKRLDALIKAAGGVKSEAVILEARQ